MLSSLRPWDCPLVSVCRSRISPTSLCLLCLLLKFLHPSCYSTGAFSRRKTLRQVYRGIALLLRRGYLDSSTMTSLHRGVSAGTTLLPRCGGSLEYVYLFAPISAARSSLKDECREKRSARAEGEVLGRRSRPRQGVPISAARGRATAGAKLVVEPAGWRAAFQRCSLADPVDARLGAQPPRGLTAGIPSQALLLRGDLHVLVGQLHYARSSACMTLYRWDLCASGIRPEFRSALVRRR